jgi:uncharacterized protein (DUF1330 family)
LHSDTEAAINRVFTIQFPDETAAETFFADESYLAVKRLHFAHSVAAVTIMASYHILDDSLD